MTNVLIKFEREDREGYVAVGTYLIDAANRFGIDLTGPDEQDQEANVVSVVVASGSEYLSPLTQAEHEHFKSHGRRENERLASQAKIEREGEIIVMTNEKKKNEEAAAGDPDENYKKEFTEMPLEKKIAALVQLEAIAIGETFSFIFNSPSMVVSKIMDVMAEFGLKKEADAKDSVRPDEHKKPDGKRKSKPTNSETSAV